MTSCAWLWIYLGSVLMLLELLVPGFIMCFFGLSAVTVGVIRFIVGDSFTLAWQLASFSVLSIFYILVFRHYFTRIFVGGKVVAKTDFDNEYVGRRGKVVEAIGVDLPGRVVIGDAEWPAEADAPIEVGANVKVIFNNNLTMKVEEIK